MKNKESASWDNFLALAEETCIRRGLEKHALSVIVASMMDALQWAFDAIENQAEANMLPTGKLEGMHYTALKAIREELRVPRKQNDKIRDRDESAGPQP